MVPDAFTGLIINELCSFLRKIYFFNKNIIC